jgi:hypothetical protein
VAVAAAAFAAALASEGGTVHVTSSKGSKKRKLAAAAAAAVDQNYISAPMHQSGGQKEGRKEGSGDWEAILNLNFNQ